MTTKAFPVCATFCHTDGNDAGDRKEEDESVAESRDKSLESAMKKNLALIKPSHSYDGMKIRTHSYILISSFPPSALTMTAHNRSPVHTTKVQRDCTCISEEPDLSTVLSFMDRTNSNRSKSLSKMWKSFCEAGQQYKPLGKNTHFNHNKADSILQSNNKEFSKTVGLQMQQCAQASSWNSQNVHSWLTTSCVDLDTHF